MSVDSAKIMNSTQFRKIARIAIRTNRNRQVEESFLKTLDPQGVHIVAFEMIHNDVEMRCRILVKQKGTREPAEVWLDMPFKEYDRLATVADWKAAVAAAEEAA